MGKIKFYVAASLDGFLSDKDGGVDWLVPFQNESYDYGYADFMETIGYVISGSKTYEQVKDFPGGWNFPNRKSYIFTSRTIDTNGRDDIELWNGSVPDICDLLRKNKKDTWLLGGANLAGQFFNGNYVDELILSIMPIVLGEGRPLFDGIDKPLSMKLKNVETFKNGVVQMCYGF